MVRNARTGEPIAGASVKVKNITDGVNKMINHDIFSGVYTVYNQYFTDITVIISI